MKIKNFKLFESEKKSYRRSELTEEMFDQWILDVRKEFGGNIKTSMNLIAMGIRNMDDPNSTNKDKWRKSLWQFFENHLAHQNRLLCDNCGGPMGVYYTVHCFKCEKPEVEDSELNYFLCVRWLEKNEEDFNGDELWDYLLKNEVIKGNDTYCKLPSESNDKNMKIFMNHFDTKKIKYFVSW
jgi:hypothetical protein